MTRWQRHPADLSRIPCAHDESPALWIRFDLRDDAVDLIDAHAAFAAPIAPLRTVNATELAVVVGPFIPDCNAMFVEITNVRIAAQEPEQLVDDRFDVQLFREIGRASCREGVWVWVVGV